jgi:hypothetical protein
VFVKCLLFIWWRGWLAARCMFCRISKQRLASYTGGAGVRGHLVVTGWGSMWGEGGAVANGHWP